jgi:deazaflavin-dependent oxidoreductase (nitroreductase family)
MTIRVLLLTTTGRRSGKRRTAPLGYFESDDAYVITASNGGSPRQPAWYYNLRADPSATIQVGKSVIEVHAEEATGEDRDRLWARLVEVAPTYRMYGSRTNRRIPMFVLRPTGHPA